MAEALVCTITCPLNSDAISAAESLTVITTLLSGNSDRIFASDFADAAIKRRSRYCLRS